MPGLADKSHRSGFCPHQVWSCCAARPPAVPVPSERTINRIFAREGPAFHWHLMDRGIRHICIKPATPRLNVKVERSHRFDAEESYRQRRAC